MSNPRICGFTLIEMIITLAIFAVLGLMASQMVSRVVDNHAVLTVRGDRLTEVHRAMQIMQRDILQASRQRRIRNEFGDAAEALLIGQDGLMEFTRHGWRNPLQVPRSELQRVGYVWQEEALYRSYWPVLDRAQDTEPQLQELLSDVRQVEFFAIDIAGNEHSFWPDLASGSDPSGQLAAILVRLDIPPYGIVERLWPVAEI